MGDNNLGFRETVIDGIVPEEYNTQPPREIIPADAHLWLDKPRLEAFAQFVNKYISSRRVSRGNKGPDLCEFVFCLFRYPEGARLASFLPPAAMIRSTSKSRTRPAAISSSPL